MIAQKLRKIFENVENGLCHGVAASGHTDDYAFKFELHEGAHHFVDRHVEFFGDVVDVNVAGFLDDFHHRFFFRGERGEEIELHRIAARFF